MARSSVSPEVTDNLPGLGDAKPNCMAPRTSSERGGTLEVVCPSYGRTGSTSMHMALEILGFGPCYHMEKVLRVHPKDHPKLWLDAFQGRGVAAHKIFDGYKSVADWPGAHFYKEILASNPSAKVVVTLRDPDAWWKSVDSTISFNRPIWSAWGFFLVEVFSAETFLFHSMIRHIKTLHMSEEEAKADYVRHNKEVRAHVPADKLLEFSVKEGWEPLCAFLGVPVPDEPFPYSKTTDVMNARFKRINNRGWRLMITTSVVAGVTVVAASFFGGKRVGGALAAAELVLLTSRIRSVLAMRQAHVEVKG